MAKLYAVLNKHGMPLGYHDDQRVVREYLHQVRDQDAYVVKVKHSKKVMSTSRYNDLYLVKYRGGYIPAMYLDTVDLMDEEEITNYQEVSDVIIRELEFCKSDISPSEYKTLEKALKYFQHKIADISDEEPDLGAIRHYHDMYEEYRNTYS